MSDCLSVAAIAHFRLGAYEESIKYAIQTLQIDRRLGDKSRISSSLNTIAGIYLAARLPQKAQNYITEALKISREIKDTARIAIQSGMAAEILHAIGNEASNKRHSNMRELLTNSTCSEDDPTVLPYVCHNSRMRSSL